MRCKLLHDFFQTALIYRIFSKNLSALQQRFHIFLHAQREHTSCLAHGTEVIETDQRFLRNIRSGTGQLRINQRQIFICCRKNAIVIEPFNIAAQVFIQLRMFIGSGKHDAGQLIDQSLHAVRRQRRQNLHVRHAQQLFQRTRAALRTDVKIRHRIHFGVKKLDTNRIIFSRHKNIQNTAANRKLSLTFYLHTAPVARQKQFLNQIFYLIFSIKINREHGLLHFFRRHGCHEQRRNRCDNGLFAEPQIAQRGNPLVLVFAGGRFDVMKDKFPCRKNFHRTLRKCFQIARHTAARQIIRTDDNRLFVQLSCQRCRQICLVNRCESRHLNR